MKLSTTLCLLVLKVQPTNTYGCYSSPYYGSEVLLWCMHGTPGMQGSHIHQMHLLQDIKGCMLCVVEGINLLRQVSLLEDQSPALVLCFLVQSMNPGKLHVGEPKHAKQEMKYYGEGL